MTYVLEKLTTKHELHAGPCKELQEQSSNVARVNVLTYKTTAVAESTDDYMSEVAKESKQDTSEFEKDSKQQDRIRIIQ
jgi:hypothetical protein